MIRSAQYKFGADLIRIYAGLAVVIIHVTDQYLTYPVLFGGVTWWLADILNAASRIAVPLFVMLSGYLLLSPQKAVSTIAFYKRRILKVVIPLIFWSAFYFFWQSGFNNVPFTPREILAITLLGGLLHIYFLNAILGLYLITPMLQLFLKTVSGKALVLIVSIPVFIAMLITLMNYYLPEVYTGHTMFTLFVKYLPYYILGFGLGLLRLTKWQTLIAAVAFVIFTVATAYANFNHFNSLAYRSITKAAAGHYFYDHFSIFVVGAACSLFVLLIQANYIKRSIKLPILKSIRSVADLVFGVYIIHIVVMNLLDVYTPLKYNNVTSPVWMYMVLVILLVFVLSAAITYIAKNIMRIPYLFGM